MKEVIQSPGATISFSSLAIINFVLAWLLNRRYPEIAENMIIYLVIVCVGFFVAMRLFYIFPQAGVLWFFLWLLLGIGAAAISAYRRNARKSRKR